jgi:hypothetical protein
MTIKPKTLASLAQEANRKATRSSIADTLFHLRGIEDGFRADAVRWYTLGLDPTGPLTKAANVREAINLIETHAIPQD